MKRKLLSALLAGALLIGAVGCQPSSQDRRVTDEPTADLLDAFEPESPAINADVVLPGLPQTMRISSGTAASKAPDEVRAVWISYLEMQTMLTGKTAKQFRTNIQAAFDNAADYGLNTVIVHVRPFGDALYDSDYYPWSYLITGTEGKNPGFDPLQIMVEEARSRDLRIEAWLNPYRVRAADNKNALSADNQARKWLDAGKYAVTRHSAGISYNPASADARKLIVNGAAEIVRNYDVDGIHIDDYFYPTTDASFDKVYYDAYKKNGGTLSLAAWRRSNVEKLLKEMYGAIKAENKNALFGISPQSSVENNYNTMYIDVEKIASTAGYCDYICPQIYFGYNNQAQPYKATLEKWNRMTQDSPVQLYVGLAVYKSGAVDSWAGSGKNEWTQNSDLLKRMVRDGRTQSEYEGFVLYRYDSIFRPASGVKSTVQKENKNLKSILD